MVDVICGPISRHVLYILYTCMHMAISLSTLWYPMNFVLHMVQRVFVAVLAAHVINNGI